MSHEVVSRKGALSDDKEVSSAADEDDDEDDDDDDDNYQRPAAAMSLSLMEALGMDTKSIAAVTTDWKAPSQSGLEHSARKYLSFLKNNVLDYNSCHSTFTHLRLW